ncbi:hypothetical protein Ocin01_13172 [Orchesella cincta]|uniref:Uncharacterized protein n=1 Tax=Orchesella cincta TaxID=48709 RepID=A0A1D2MKK9_ORCCI|nr:hypothetical protein Ocin01_13172 [Orchesella cincta]
MSIKNWSPLTSEMCRVGFSKCFFLVSILALLFIAATTLAEDPDPAAAPAPAPTPAQTGNSSGNGTFELPEPEEDKPLTPEELKVVEDINNMIGEQCLLILGDCWLQLKAKKPWLKEEKRLSMCVSQTQGFMMCSQLKPEDAEKAKTAAEEKVTKARELEEVEAKKKEEMAEKALEREEQRKLQQEKLMEERARRKEEKEAKKAAAAAEAVADGDNPDDGEKKASEEKNFDNLGGGDD